MGVSLITQMPCRTTAPPKGSAMTDEKKKDKKENEGVKDAKKIDDEQLKDVAGGSARKEGVSGDIETYYVKR